MFRRTLVLFVAAAAPAAAQPPVDPAKLTLDRIFASEEFRGDRVPAVRWLAGGAYTSTQPSKAHKGASDLVRVDAAGKVEVLVPAEKLLPPNAKEPLSVQGYELSKDLDLVLIYTNSAKVWRQNTRGDYWTLRRSTDKLTKLGGDAKPSTLMFAKLSPDGTRVGYVRENNLYLERPTAARRRRSRRTAVRKSSTAPSTGCTRRNSTAATGGGGVRTASGLPTGSSTPAA